MTSLPAAAKRELKELITDDDTDKCLKVLRDIRDEVTSAPSLRFAAATDLLDRKHGKARQFVEQTVRVDSYVDFIDKVIVKEGKFQQVVENPLDVVVLPMVRPDWSQLL